MTTSPATLVAPPVVDNSAGGACRELGGVHGELIDERCAEYETIKDAMIIMTRLVLRECKGNNTAMGYDMTSGVYVSYGHALEPQRTYVEDGCSVGRWAQQQAMRKSLAAGILGGQVPAPLIESSSDLEKQSSPGLTWPRSMPGDAVATAWLEGV